MVKYTAKELGDLRRWYRKWAIRYSTLYLAFAIASLLSPSIYLAKFFIALMAAMAIVSSLHLWPAIKATLIVRENFIRGRFELYIQIFAWCSAAFIIIFTDPNIGNLRGPIFIIFLVGLPLAQWEALLNRIEKGD